MCALIHVATFLDGSYFVWRCILVKSTRLFLSRLNNVQGETIRSLFLSGYPVGCTYSDTLVKVFVWNMLIYLSFLHQFRLNLVKMIIGYLHIYGADEGEVKGHVGSKGQVEYGHVYHFGVKVCVNRANFFISASILFQLGTDDHWVLAYGAGYINAIPILTREKGKKDVRFIRWYAIS